MNSIYQALSELEKNNQSAALCTVVKSEGSTPRHVGSKMLVYPNGKFIGTVGGGELENRVHKAALESMKSGEHQTILYSMVDPSRGDPGVCGGTVEVFVEPILPPAMIVVIGAGHVGKAHLQGKHRASYTPFMDLGDHVVVINAARVKLTGRKEEQKLYRRHRSYEGGLREERAKDVRKARPGRIVEEAIRGMLPKTKLGDAMYRKLKLYEGAAHPHAAQKPTKLEVA